MGGGETVNTCNAEIGKRIKQYRKGKMTQRELADKIGKTESSIRKYENGLVTIPLNVIEAIATALNVHPYELFPDDLRDEAYANEEHQLFRSLQDYLDDLDLTIEQDEHDYIYDELQICSLEDGTICKIQKQWLLGVFKDILHEADIRKDEYIIDRLKLEIKHKK